MSPLSYPPYGDEFIIPPSELGMTLRVRPTTNVVSPVRPLTLPAGTTVDGGGLGIGGDWGEIGGDIEDQTDLQAAFDDKEDEITAGTTAQYLRGDKSLGTFPTTTASFFDSTNRRYVSDAERVVIQATSGTNTGDQDLSGLVPTSRTVNGQALSSNVVLTAADISAQASSSNLSAIAGVASAADRLFYFTGSGTGAVISFNSVARALIDDATTAAQRITLGLEIGVNVVAYSANLDGWSAITPYAGRIIVTADKIVTFANTLNFVGVDDAELDIGSGGALGSAAYVNADTFAPTAQGVSTFVMTTDNVVYATPVTFSQVAQAWTGTIALKTQSANTFFGNGTAGVAAPTFMSAATAKTALAIAAGDVSGLAASATTDTTSASNISSGTLAVARGGTNLASYTVGDLIFASGAAALAKLAGVVVGNVLLAGGVATAPSFGKITSAHVDSTIPLKTDTLAVFASTTSAQLATLISNETGSGVLVFNSTPTLVTPVLGVATATSINNVAFTAPAGTATITLTSGKTLSVINTLAFQGTDSTAMTFPTTSAIVARTDNVNTFTGLQTFAAATGINIAGTNLTDSALKIGTFEIQPYALNNSWLGENIYFDGLNFKARATGAATMFYFAADRLEIRNYSSVSAGTTLPQTSTMHVSPTGFGVSAAMNAGNFVGARFYVDFATAAHTLLFDASNQFITTVSSAGSVTFDAVGASAGFKFSDNVGVGVSSWGSSGTNVLGIGNGAEPSTSPADMVQLYSVDLSAGNATLGLRTETAVTVAAAGASDAYLNIRVNGATWKLLLHT